MNYITRTNDPGVIDDPNENNFDNAFMYMDDGTIFNVERNNEGHLDMSQLHEGRSYKLLFFYLLTLFIVIRIFVAVVETKNVVLIIIFSIATLSLFAYFLVKRREYANRRNTNLFLLASMLNYSQRLRQQMSDDLQGTVSHSRGLTDSELQQLNSTYVSSSMLINDSNVLIMNIPKSFVSPELQGERKDDSDDGGKEMHVNTQPICCVEPTRSTISEIENNTVIRCDKTCTICLDEFKVNDFVTILPCKHIYHQKCIFSWFDTHNDCPLCKRVVSSCGEETRTAQV